jgi:hypothetical protein
MTEDGWKGEWRFCSMEHAEMATVKRLFWRQTVALELCMAAPDPDRSLGYSRT